MRDYIFTFWAGPINVHTPFYWRIIDRKVYHGESQFLYVVRLRTCLPEKATDVYRMIMEMFTGVEGLKMVSMETQV